MRHFITIIILFFLISCSSNKTINEKLQGVWIVDSVESYEHGLIKMDRDPNEYWEFNKFDNIVYFTKDSIKFVHYYKIDKSGITVYENKKSDSITTYNIKKIKDSSLTLYIQFLDNSAATWYLKKAKNQNLKEDLLQNKLKNEH